MRTRALKLGIPTGLAALALILGACGGGDSTSDNGDGDATTAPTTAATDAPSDGGDDGELLGGKTPAEFFVTNCSACHGPNREGISGLGKPLLPDTLIEDDEFYIDTILNGRVATVMPPWGQQGVSRADAEALLAYFRATP